jgi:hypothetical protein
MPKVGQPRLNHVALSVHPDALDEQGRREIIDFYSAVFGWQELPTETIDRKRLVLMIYRIDQFLFIHADDPPMSGPKLDHFGLGVASVDELDTFYQRAQRYRDKDDRVDIIDKQVEEHPGISLTSFYVKFLLPMMVEVQHFGFHDRRQPGDA